MPSRWLNELGHAGAEHPDPAFVAGYDAKQQFDPSDDVEALVGLGLGPSTRLLDLGAGTGTLTVVAAAATGADVTAIDVSPAMVEHLGARSAAAPDVEVCEGGFLSYEHNGEPFDFVYCRNVLHQLPDFWKVIALWRVAGWLRPGGVLMLRDLVYDLAPDEIEAGIEAWFDRAVDDPATGYTADDFADHVRTEHSTFTWLLEPMLERTGFEIVARDVRRGVYASYTCRRARPSADEG
jgi:SAM-dependent methyltransferase